MERCTKCGKTEYVIPLVVLRISGRQRFTCLKCFYKEIKPKSKKKTVKD